MNKFKLTAEKEKKQQQQQLSKNNSNKPIRMPQDKYTFTPEDFKYENKHYKYIKYTKYNKVKLNSFVLRIGIVVELILAK